MDKPTPQLPPELVELAGYATRALPWALTAGVILASALCAAALVLLTRGDPRADGVAVAGILVAALAGAVNHYTKSIPE